MGGKDVYRLGGKLVEVIMDGDGSEIGYRPLDAGPVRMERLDVKISRVVYTLLRFKAL